MRRIRERGSAIVGCALLLMLAGCNLSADDIADLLEPETTSVRLVNNGDFPVEVEIYIDDEQDIPESVLTESGTLLTFTVAAGETQSFTRDCDDLQAIIVDDADLMTIGSIGPDTDTGVLRDGDDFSCGDTIVFTFDHSDVIVDFDVNVSVLQNSGS